MALIRGANSDLLSEAMAWGDLAPSDPVQSAEDLMSLWLGLLDAVVVSLYGVVATRQPDHFGQVDRVRPDRMDFVGASVALFGVLVMYGPRSTGSSVLLRAFHR